MSAAAAVAAAWKTLCRSTHVRRNVRVRPGLKKALPLCEKIYFRCLAGRSARGLTQRRCVRVCSREMVTLRAVVLNDGESPPPVGKFGTPLPPVELELDPRRIAVFAAPSVTRSPRCVYTPLYTCLKRRRASCSDARA